MAVAGRRGAESEQSPESLLLVAGWPRSGDSDSAPGAESESPESLPESPESLLLSSTRLGGLRRHSASGDESDESPTAGRLAE